MSEQRRKDDEGKAPEQKKAYYSPKEVMKKKGCIGCGGMALSLMILAAGLVVALAF